MFYSIMEVVLNHGPEELILALLFKHQIIPIMAESLHDVKKNDIILTNTHCDALLFTIKRITTVIDSVMVRIVSVVC